jgi:hypothetical protein
VIPDVPVMIYPGSSTYRQVYVEIDERPDALVFKGRHRASLRARVCGKCGFAKLFVHKPEELLAAYRSQQGP